MRKVLLVILSCLLLNNTIEAQLVDSLHKNIKTNWMRVRNIDIKHIKLDLQFDSPKKQA